MAQHVGDDIQEGVKTAARETEKAVHTAQAVSKAAAKAAAQDYLGAATEVLKDENLRTVIAIILLFSFFLTIAIFFMMPLALFESITKIWDVVSEKFAQGYYSGGDGWFESLWKGFVGVFDKDSDVGISLRDVTFGSEDQGETEDSKIFADEERTKNIYERKLKAAIDKVSDRQDQIENAIRSSGVIEAVFQGRYNSEWAHKYDDDEYTTVEYAGCDYSVGKRRLTKNQALTLLTLHSIQTGTSVSNIQLSSFLKWLGYNRNSHHTIDFDLGGASASIGAWKGTFLPQYLVDEAEARDEQAMFESQDSEDTTQLVTLPEKKTEFQDAYKDEYGCSAIDFLTVVNCPNLYSVSARVEETVNYSFEQREYYVTHHYIQYNKADVRRIAGTAIVPRYYINSLGELVCSNEAQVRACGRYTNTSRYGYMVWVLRGQRGPYYGGYDRFQTAALYFYVQVKHTHYKISYNTSVFITLRNLKSIVKAVGLWQGWRTFDPEYEYFSDQVSDDGLVLPDQTQIASDTHAPDDPDIPVIPIDGPSIEDNNTEPGTGRIDDPIPVISIGG